MTTTDTEYKTWTRAEKAADVALAEAERIAIRGWHGKHGGVFSVATVRLADGGLLLVSRDGEQFSYRLVPREGEESDLDRDEACRLLLKGLGK